MRVSGLRSFLKVKPKPLGIIVLIVALIVIWNPFGLDASQQVIFSTLLFAVGSWATGALDRTVTSLLLLVLFLIFGHAPPLTIVGFLWSNTLLLIVFSGLLSVALGKSALLKDWLGRFIQATTKNRVLFYAVPYLLGIVLVFLIPQAFARVVLLAGLYDSMLRRDDPLKAAKQAVFFNIYLAVTVTYMMFIGGDVVLNYAAVAFAGEAVAASLTGFVWFKLMALPSLVTAILMIGLVVLMFKTVMPAQPAELFAVAGDAPETGMRAPHAAPAGGYDVFSLVLMVIVMLFWATENMHGLAGWIPAAVGVLILFLIGKLNQADLSAVNPRFLIFLMAAFNIGHVLRSSGVMDKIMVQLQTIIPDGRSLIFLPALMLVTMLLHVFLGSCVATLSVVLPLLLPLSAASGFSPVWLTLMLYITTNMHFLLPFHHATMMIGVGKGHMSERHLLRFGLIMTGGIFILIFLIYLPWWQLVGA